MTEAVIIGALIAVVFAVAGIAVAIFAAAIETWKERRDNR